MPHPAMIFIEIIKLYILATDKDSIPKEDLEKAFKEMVEILEEKTNSDLIYTFSIELKEFLNSYPDLFEETPTTIKITDDINTIYSTIVKSLKPNIIDYDIARLIYNLDIYAALKIEIKTAEVDPFFNANKELLSIFTRLAYQESQNQDITDTLEELKTKGDAFIAMFDELDNGLLTKLNIATHIYDFKYMPEVSENEDYPWMIILFSNSEQRWQSLTYSTVASYCASMEELLSEEGEEVLEGYIDEESRDNEEENENVNLNVIEVFLGTFLIYLHKFLKLLGNCPGRETLIIKKYLLLSLPELGEYLEFFLQNKTLDNLPFPSIPSIPDENYESELYKSCIDLIPKFHISDFTLNQNPNLYSDLIISAIFFKCFLKVTLNDQDKQALIALITNPDFYKNPNFNIVTDIIDSIIFNDNLDLVR